MKNKDKSILLVEDNAINRRIAEFYLKSLGREYDVAVNGEIAVNKFAEKKYDLIIMDVSMPIMDGLEATKRIREIEKQTESENKTKIFALTSNDKESCESACYEAGMDKFKQKPVSKDEFSEYLANAEL